MVIDLGSLCNMPTRLDTRLGLKDMAWELGERSWLEGGISVRALHLVSVGRIVTIWGLLWWGQTTNDRLVINFA
jgi:hypothetical protein